MSTSPIGFSCSAPASEALAKLRDKLGWGEDREVVAEAEEVLVARDQEGLPADGEGEEIVVIGIW
jgi:hypothetical protein